MDSECVPLYLSKISINQCIERCEKTQVIYLEKAHFWIFACKSAGRLKYFTRSVDRRKWRVFKEVLHEFTARVLGTFYDHMFNINKAGCACGTINNFLTESFRITQSI
jgi:hypothetical protein